ncbi:hypothetical protein GA0070606_2966 [Micromonospora citrea]|uniref:Uncharacterized protein n=1 Tax=Micromonospora citrea TaxID=47855 RepID=A0A1C6UX81_9ACTN|nr:hypothetical protein GA0070606_2966 [Micromonospora citrea]
MVTARPVAKARPSRVCKAPAARPPNTSPTARAIVTEVSGPPIARLTSRASAALPRRNGTEVRPAAATNAMTPSRLITPESMLDATSPPSADVRAARPVTVANRFSHSPSPPPALKLWLNGRRPPHTTAINCANRATATTSGPQTHTSRRTFAIRDMRRMLGAPQRTFRPQQESRPNRDQPTTSIPSAIDPPSWGAGHRPARHVKRTLTPVRTLAGRAVVCSACPGRWRAGWLPPRPPTDRDSPTKPWPSWSRSAPAGGAVAATSRPPPVRRRGRRALPYAARLVAARPGRLPAHPHPINAAVVMRRPLRAFRSPRQPPGVLRARSRSASVATGRAPRRRRVRPVQGRLDRRTESPHTGRQPPVGLHLMRDAAAPLDG